jgi:hypothetical protein
MPACTPSTFHSTSIGALAPEAKPQDENSANASKRAFNGELKSVSAANAQARLSADAPSVAVVTEGKPDSDPAILPTHLSKIPKMAALPPSPPPPSPETRARLLFKLGLYKMFRVYPQPATPTSEHCGRVGIEWERKI